MGAGVFECLDDEDLIHDDDYPHDKKSRKRKRPPATSFSSQVYVALDLKISGVKCILHRNDNTALKIDEGKHMMDYFENAQEDSSDSPSAQYTADDWKDIVHDGDDNANRLLQSEPDSNEVELKGEGGLATCTNTSRSVLLIDRYDVRGLMENISDLERFLLSF